VKADTHLENKNQQEERAQGWRPHLL